MHLSLKRAGFLTLAVRDALQYSYPLHCSDAGKRLPGVRTMKRAAHVERVAHNQCQTLFQAQSPRGPDQPSPLLDPSAEALRSSRGWAAKPNGVIRAKGGRLKTPREAGGRAFAPLPNCPGKPVLRRDRNPLTVDGATLK